ncbi:MAG: bifunctional phosphopantothenoylcysteine decarboxylase/phosphopantothenate--cysteine ligase CoaBC [Francisellaceae bacterium]
MRKVLLMVSGGIAAYKACELARLWVKSGVKVKVVMSQAAKQFVAPLSFEAICGARVYDDCFDYVDDSIEHIELARWPDAIVIAPATANTIARLACGLADNLLSTLVLATTKPVFIAPAMNKYMWQNQQVQHNVNHLIASGFYLLPPESGQQACGDVGYGRMMAPEVIYNRIYDQMQQIDVQTWPINGKKSALKVMITAGPTVEAIDPVRFLSNHSSGKMGYALASCFTEYGCDVTLISGPVQLDPPAEAKCILVKSADQMYEAVMTRVDTIDIFIAAAAVADFKVESIAKTKLKKSEAQSSMTLKLVKNKDILAEVADKRRVFCVGFAAETDNAEVNAREKLKRKGADMLILNEVDAASGFPFYADDSQNSVFFAGDQEPINLPRSSKKVMARQLIDLILKQYTRELACKNVL